MTNIEGRKNKSEKPEVSSEKMEQATKLSEDAERLAKQGYKEKKDNPIEAEKTIQEAREMLAKAREILEGKEAEETLEGREDKEVLEKLFNEQKQKLLDLGYPEALGIDENTFLTKYIEPLRKELNKVPENIPEGNLPFLIVIPDYVLDIEKKMSMVKFGKKTCYVSSSFNFEKLEDIEGIETPDIPYLIFDVENGEKMKGSSVDDCVEQFTKENRRGLTAQEGIDLIAHYPEILQYHSIDLVGSLYGSEGAPHLWLNSGISPKLDSSWNGGSKGVWRSASCLRKQ